MQDNDGRKGLAWEQALGVLGVPFTVSIHTYKPKANVLKNTFQRACSCRTVKILLLQRRPADSWFLYPFLQGCYTGSWRLVWRDRNGTLPSSNLLTAICFQSAGEELAETPCYKQLILKSQYTPTVLGLRGRAPRQFGNKVSLWITNTAHLWFWGPFTLKRTETHLGLFYLEDYKIWENSYAMCSKTTMQVFLFVSTFAAYVQIIAM